MGNVWLTIMTTGSDLLSLVYGDLVLQVGPDLY